MLRERSEGKGPGGIVREEERRWEERWGGMSEGGTMREECGRKSEGGTVREECGRKSEGGTVREECGMWKEGTVRRRIVEESNEMNAKNGERDRTRTKGAIP